VDPGLDVEKLAKKVRSCSLIQEKKRKAFVLDAMTKNGADWEKLKRRKVSVFSHMAGPVGAEAYASLFEVYAKCKTVDEKDGISDDLLVALLPGPPPDEPTDMNLIEAVREFKALAPKHTKPKCGKVEATHADCMRRLRFKNNQFSGQSQDNIVFTCERKVLNVSPMKFLENGSIVYNKWPVPAIPFEQLLRSSKEVYEKMSPVGAEQDAMKLEDEFEVEALPDELELGALVIPFPREMSHKLSQELINVFQIDILIDLFPGSGEKMKAILLSNVRGVCCCRTQAHKKFIVENLLSFVKLHRLCATRQVPKPLACCMFEKRAACSPQPQTVVIPSGLLPAALSTSKQVLPDVVDVTSDVKPSPFLSKAALPSPLSLAAFGAGKL
jgi:hypothetical protein